MMQPSPTLTAVPDHARDCDCLSCSYVRELTAKLDTPNCPCKSCTDLRSCIADEIVRRQKHDRAKLEDAAWSEARGPVQFYSQDANSAEIAALGLEIDQFEDQINGLKRNQMILYAAYAAGIIYWIWSHLI